MKKQIASCMIFLILLCGIGFTGVTTVGCQHNVTVGGATTTTISENLLLSSAKAVDGISIACKTAVDIVLVVMPQNTKERRDILNVIANVVKADEIARATIVRLDAIEDITPSEIAAQLTPYLIEMKGMIDQGIIDLGSGNEELKTKVKTWLNVIVIAINSAQGLLKAYM